MEQSTEDRLRQKVPSWIYNDSIVTEDDIAEDLWLKR